MDPLLELVIKEMKDDIKEIKDDVSKLLQFKWQIVGGSIVISAIITGLISVLGILFKN